MTITAGQVIALAQNTKALSKEQLTRISDLAPFMNETDLGKLHQMIAAVQAAEVEDMKKELETRQKVGSAYQEWKADKFRGDLQVKEGSVKGQEAAHAESLIQNI
ncbi:hypothetical protein A3J23_01390 [Candidatus Peregrinibacteria bacterium RIFCSPLOWO2_02_FULL_48_14]|nr:MAG: hypothetical protein A3J23_01390 [Candidatus Peregrinibacteria bacterium RIFCSPLOWO2_02_FULL_48_14]